MMTRKDYIKFADMLKNQGAPQLENPDQYGLWCRIVQGTADIFEEDNPNFDRDRFLQACGHLYL